MLFAGAQKFKTFHFRTVLLSADDTLSVCVCGSNGNGISLWNYALSNISLKFCATEKRLGKAAYLFNIKTCRINITRWYFSCIFNFFLLCTIVAEKRRKSNLLVFTHNFSYSQMVWNIFAVISLKWAHCIVLVWNLLIGILYRQCLMENCTNAHTQHTHTHMNNLILRVHAPNAYRVDLFCLD